MIDTNLTQVTVRWEPGKQYDSGGLPSVPVSGLGAPAHWSAFAPYSERLEVARPKGLATVEVVIHYLNIDHKALAIAVYKALVPHLP